MEPTEDKIIEKIDKQCMHCLRNGFLPYEYERTCLECGYNVLKRKNILKKFQRKKKQKF